MKNNSKKTLYNNGISLLVLVVTFAVLLTIVTIVIISSSKVVENTNLTKFANDLVEIEEATESYYIANGIMPTLDGSTAMDTEQLLAIANTSETLDQELKDNGDTDSQFNIIDLDKINVRKATYGNRQLGHNDVFVVAYPSMNIYYAYGMNADNNTYFSLTSKISNVTRIPVSLTNTSYTTTLSSGGIKVTKINGWANKMGVTIDVDMAIDEKLYMSVSGGLNREITTILGPNNFGFNLLSSIVANLETIKVPALTIEEANYIEAGIKPAEERYINIYKYKGSELVGNVKIDLSNFVNTLPVITDAKISSYSSINTATFTFSKTENTIKEVRYEYLTKYTDNAVVESYYENATDFDANYMKTKGKLANIINNTKTTIDAPKDVKSIKVAIVDKADNVTLYNQEIAPKLYIGYNVDNTTAPNIQPTANIYSLNGVKSVSFSVSNDGINFSNQQTYILNTTNDGVTIKKSNPFTNLKPTTTFLKIVAVNSDNTITETRIIKLELTNEYVYTGNRPVLASGMVAKNWDSTTNSWVTVDNPTTDTNWYNYKVGKWANAQTSDGSMWVWIPRYVYRISDSWHNSSVGVIDIQFTKGTNDNWNNNEIGLINNSNGAIASNGNWTNHPAFKFGNLELTGIWVAKFEASGNTSKIDIKPGLTSLRNVTIDEAFITCRNIETNSKYGFTSGGIGIDTHLIKDTEWGALAYLGQSIYGRNKTEVMVNNNASYYTGGGATVSYITNTNQSTTGNIYGVYDMSGGALEYTASYVNNNNTNLSRYGNSLITIEDKYKDVYTVTTDAEKTIYENSSNKKGNALYETSSLISTVSSWYDDSSVMPYSSNPFFVRGGIYSGVNSAGVFSYSSRDGKKDKTIGFRPVLIVDSTL